jgi:hypothetical protein
MQSRLQVAPDLNLANASYRLLEVFMALSFAADIRPLFRDSPDIDAMKSFGLDLSSYDDVKAQAEAIYSRLDDGSMPCDDPWPKEQIAKFKQWMDDGMAP